MIFIFGRADRPARDIATTQDVKCAGVGKKKGKILTLVGVKRLVTSAVSAWRIA